MAHKRIALVGADGSLGPVLVNALASSGKFTVTVLKRTSSNSQSKYPSSVHVTRISDSFPHDELVNALKGKDALVVSIRGLVDLQKRLADAALEAGVKQFIPGDFGSCDSQDERVRRVVSLYEKKTEIRNYAEELSARHDGFAYTSVVCGHFFDDMDLIHIDLKTRTLGILDDGETRFSASTRKQVGSALVKVLEKGVTDETRNKTLYVQSFCVTQNQVRAALERTTGQAWKVERFDSSKFLKEELDKGDDHVARENVVWVLGTRYANWEEKEGFAHQLLGLPQENLDEVVARLCA